MLLKMKMKHLLAVAFVSFVSATQVCAQTKMDALLTTMPKEVVPYLDKEQLAELAQFASKGVSSVKNTLEGQTTVDSISADYLRLKLSDFSTLQMRLLSVGDTAQILCVVKTVKRPVADSRVAFYDTQWKRVDTPQGLPVLADIDGLLDEFTERPDTMSVERYEELRGWIEPVLLQVDASTSPDVLVYELSMPLLNNDDRRQLAVVMRRQLYRWDGAKFKKD